MTRADREAARRQRAERAGQPRWPLERTGTEPITARSPLGIRLLLSGLFLPLFLAATVGFGYWTSQAGPRDVPGEGSLRTLTVIFAVLTLFALVDLVIVLRRRARARRSHQARERSEGQRGA